MESMKWDTISFDCYGTLVDWESGIADVFCDAAATSGVTLDRNAILTAYHEIEPKVQAGSYRLYKEVLSETALRVAEWLGWPLTHSGASFLAESLPDWPVFEDARPALERLKSRFDIAILSNIDDDLLQATLARIAVEFDWTVTAQNTRSYKPAHPHFREAIRRVGGDRGRLLHAAQSYYHDIAPATGLGLSAIWINRKGEDQPAGRSPLHTVRNLAALADWLEV